MGRASRRKRVRRERVGLDSPSNAPVARRQANSRRSAERGKISAALTSLVAPFVEDNIRLGDLRGLIGIGVIAWNLSVLGEPSLDLLADQQADQDEDYRVWFVGLVSELSARKRALFSNDDRFIAGWEVSLRPDGSYFVSAVAVGHE